MGSLELSCLPTHLCIGSGLGALLKDSGSSVEEHVVRVHAGMLSVAAWSAVESVVSGGAVWLSSGSASLLLARARASAKLVAMISSIDSRTSRSSTTLGSFSSSAMLWASGVLFAPLPGLPLPFLGEEYFAVAFELYAWVGYEPNEVDGSDHDCGHTFPF